MTYDDKIKIADKAEQMVSDLINTAGYNTENLLLLVKNLYQFGEKHIDAIEREKGIAHRIECKAGCSYCCYAQVSLTPPEAFLIRHHIKENFSLQKIDRLMKQAASNIRLTKDKSLEECIEVWDKTPCIFLDNDRCSIYQVRPFICRAWHSLSADQCKKAFESGDKDSEIDSTPYRNIIYGAIREGLIRGSETLGCTTQPIVITQSLKTILNHPAPDEAWLKGEPLFND